MLNKEKTVIALGYFDSVHKGHRKVIEKARCYAKEQGASLTVFTFKGNLKAMLSGEKEKNVYTAKEREKLLKDIGADQIYFAPVNKSFLSKGRLAFLNLLNKKFNIIAYFSGDDYSFGKYGKGKIDYLTRYANLHDQKHVVVKTYLSGGERVSTTRIKGELEKGEIKLANQLLGKDYFVTGKVFGDRKVGTSIGFPTLNLKIDYSKFTLKNAVYSGYICWKGKEYKAIINYGARPTFDLKEKLIEAHIIDFNQDLYGKEITLYFSDYIREIQKFSSSSELVSQLKKDVLCVKGEHV